MFAGSLILIVLAVLPGPILSLDRGINSYCQKSSLYYWKYPPTPIECCGDAQKCEGYIEAQKTNYGLRNPDLLWSRRMCHCDVTFWSCLENDMKPATRRWAWNLIKNDFCFMPVRRDASQPNVFTADKFEFVQLSEILNIFKK